MSRATGKHGSVAGMACDQCFRCKVRCSGDRPVCERCRKADGICSYSTGKPLGKPKGSKNRTKSGSSNGNVQRSPSTASKPILQRERSGRHLSLPSIADIQELQNPTYGDEHRLNSAQLMSPTQTPLPSPHIPLLSDDSGVQQSHQVFSPSFHQYQNLALPVYQIYNGTNTETSKGLHVGAGDLYKVPEGAFTLDLTTNIEDSVMLTADFGVEQNFLDQDASLMYPDATLRTSTGPRRYSSDTSWHSDTMETGRPRTADSAKGHSADSSLDLLALPNSSKVIGLLFAAVASRNDLTTDTYLSRAQDALHLIKSCIDCYHLHHLSEGMRGQSRQANQSMALLICCQLLQSVAYIYMKLLRRLSGHSTRADAIAFHLGVFQTSLDIGRSVLEMIIKRSLRECATVLESLKNHQEDLESNGYREAHLILPHLKTLSALLTVPAQDVPPASPGISFVSCDSNMAPG